MDKVEFSRDCNEGRHEHNKHCPKCHEEYHREFDISTHCGQSAHQQYQSPKCHKDWNQCPYCNQNFYREWEYHDCHRDGC